MDPFDDLNERLRSTSALTSSFVGLSKSEAAGLAVQQGLHLRVVDLDDVSEEGVILTLDLRPDRVTVYIRDRLVTRAEAG